MVVELCCLEGSKTKAAQDELVPVLTAEDGRPSIEQLVCRVPCDRFLLSQGLQEDLSLSGWREWAVKGTSAWRQLSSVVVWCPGHICFTEGELGAVLSCCLAAVLACARLVWLSPFSG